MSSTSLSSTGKKDGVEFAGERPGEVGLAATRRPVEQQPTADAAAKLGAQLGHPQRSEEAELEAAFDIGQAGDVVEPNTALLVLGDHRAEEFVELVESNVVGGDRHFCLRRSPAVGGSRR